MNGQRPHTEIVARGWSDRVRQLAVVILSDIGARWNEAAAWDVCAWSSTAEPTAQYPLILSREVHAEGDENRHHQNDEAQESEEKHVERYGLEVA